MRKQYLTDSTRKLQINTLFDSNDLGVHSLPTVTIFPDEMKQEILGFGVAMTDASCFILKTMPEPQRKKLLDDIFSTEGLGLNIARIAVGSSDYACKCYNCDNVRDDYELKHFNIDYNKENIIPALKQVKEINPEIFFFSSLWSAPGWMKTGDSMYGGWLREKYLEVFSDYYLRFIQEYKQQGIDIQAFTPQNESETDQCGKSIAEYVHPEFEQRIVCDYMIPKLRAAGMNTQAWILDHNFNMWNRANWMLNDAATSSAVSGVAFHYYDGTAAMATQLHNAHPDIDIHWTEGGPNLGADYENEWAYWGRIFSEALDNWCKSITVWNLILDEYGNPNIGPFRCAGLVTLVSKTSDLIYGGQYHALGHFTKFVKKGARYLRSQSSSGLYDHSGEDHRLYHSAFKNPDGSIVVVLTNPGSYQDICLRIKEKALRITMPENSLVTITFDSIDMKDM